MSKPAATSATICQRLSADMYERYVFWKFIVMIGNTIPYKGYPYYFTLHSVDGKLELLSFG